MKSNIITAAIILTGCLCAWGYLAAQSDEGSTLSVISSIEDSPSIEKSEAMQIVKALAELNTTLSEYSPSLKSPLMEIKKPSLEDFEHCAKRALDFMESWSEDQVKNDTASQKFLESGELTPQQTVAMNKEMTVMTAELTYLKNKITYGCPELIGTRSYGENVIILYYHYRTDKWPVYCRFGFDRTFDQNGEPLKWRCQPAEFRLSSDISRVGY